MAPPAWIGLRLQFWFIGLNFPKKGYFQSRIDKSEHYHWILRIQISLGTKFKLKLTILILGTKFAQKGYFWFEIEKVNNTIEFCILELFCIIDTKFYLKTDNLDFWTKFTQKECFWSKMEKVNITIKLWKFEFQLNLTILIFRTNFAQKGYLLSKTKNEHHHWILHIWVSFGTKFYFKQFWIFGPNLPKKVFWVESERSEHRHWILLIRFSVRTKFQPKLPSLIFWTKFAQKGYFQSKT